MRSTDRTRYRPQAPATTDRFPVMASLEFARSGCADLTLPEVEVAVLGPVEVRGTAQPFQRSSARELVVYLAFHRQGARSDVWSTALWADRSIAPSTLHSTASAARRSLGRSQKGIDHLPRRGRVLRLEDSVGSDVERFARAAAETDPASWKVALSLVRGRLFDGLGLCDWAVLDGTEAQVESLVVDTALKAAHYFLERGCGEEAEWMIRRGLRVSPYDERLYRALFWAAEVMGNRIGLRSAMDELLCVAAEGRAPKRRRFSGGKNGLEHSSIHPKTVELFFELARGDADAARGDLSRL
jgi:DNA-binding SARP family transcriptional activator